MGKFRDLTGMKFGELTVVDRAKNRISHNGTQRVYWNCMCSCGNKTTVRSESLTRGDTVSCGCLRTIDLTGKVFGRLTVIEKAQSKKCGKTTRGYWKCLCECGSVVFVDTSALRRGDTRSCGCIKSYGEERISQILTSKNVDYQREYKFDELVSDKNWPLRFDFALIKDGMLSSLIEFQGEQHFKEKSNRFGEQQRLVTDKMKYDFCKNKGIPLFYITYEDDVDEKCTQIIGTLYANTVPSSEKSEKV